MSTEAVVLHTVGGIDVIIWLAGAPHDGIATVLALTDVAGSILRIEHSRQLHIENHLENFNSEWKRP